MQIEDGGSEADQDDIQSDIERAGRTGSTSFAVGVGAGTTSINPVFAIAIEEQRKEKRKKLGKLGGKSNMVSSRHVGDVTRNPTVGAAGGGGSGMAAGRVDDEYWGDDSTNNGAAGGGGTATAVRVAKTSGAACAASAANSKSSVSPSVPHMESPWQRMGASSGKGKSVDESGDVTAVGGGGDDGISEGIESKRPDLMIALDDGRLNRTSSMEIDGGGGDGGDGGGGDVDEGAETKGPDSTIVLDDDDRREERNKSIHV
jgi:hypothetical protein